MMKKAGPPLTLLQEDKKKSLDSFACFSLL